MIGYVISDLHIGGGEADKALEDFFQDDALSQRSAQPQSGPAWATVITATATPAITRAIPAAGVRSGGAAHGGWSTSVDLTVVDRGDELACGVRNRLVRRGGIEL